ncbi:DNA/RNA helicase domain-containing protein [Leuconostoc lactis]|uniref:DNA/RNA helicase domain-containing protein n=1 Tax=Leuconostoc lactis TaxID=1246 RepID=UPI0028A58EDC|nr:DNA/RNA helicase domain-containing protein [Leuconostoc lactis]
MLKLRPITLAELKEVTESHEHYNSLMKNLMKVHGFQIKDHEIDNLVVLLSNLDETNFENWESSFYFSSVAPSPINDEFDMLHFDQKSILNLDFKNSTFDKKKTIQEIQQSVLKKFKRQERLLNTFKEDRSVFSISMYMDGDETYYWKYLSPENELKKINMDDVVSIFNLFDLSKGPNELGEIDASKFIISPITDTTDFLNKKYWLTEEQNNIVSLISDVKSTDKVFSVQGSGGSGKTMVAFDLLMKFPDQKKLYTFTGSKQHGHDILESRIPNLTIVGAKKFANMNLDNFDLIIVDEAQRAFKNVRRKIDECIREATNNSFKRLVVFFDVRQALSKNDFGQGIKSLLTGRSVHSNLKSTIRSKETVNAFIEKIFDLSYTYKNGISIEEISEDVEIRYFKDFKTAKKWLEGRKSKGYSILEKIPEYGKNRQFSDSKITSEVIGQDIENVGILINESFYYKFIQNGEGKTGKLVLDYKNSNKFHYDPISNLYVNLSRAKSKLAIAIVNNPQVIEALGDYIFKQR